MHSIVHIVPEIVYVCIEYCIPKATKTSVFNIAKLFEVKLKYSDMGKLMKRENKNTKIFGWTKVSFRLYVCCLVVI